MGRAAQRDPRPAGGHKGIAPADAELTARPDAIPAWEDMDDKLKPVLERQMERYAGFLEHTDQHVGRLIDTLENIGALDNTLIYYIIGDNGASAEGTVNGAFNEMANFNGLAAIETPEFMAAMKDKLGTADAYNHYSVGSAWAMCSPFQWTKQVASHWGGTRNGIIVHWPGRIATKGGLGPVQSRNRRRTHHSRGGGVEEPIVYRDRRHRGTRPRRHERRDHQLPPDRPGGERAGGHVPAVSRAGRGEGARIRTTRVDPACRRSTCAVRGSTPVTRVAEESTVKYMIIMRSNDESTAAFSEVDFDQILEVMGRYNYEMIQAGVLVAAEGLDDAAKGVVVDYSAETPIVTDGPYGETKELFGGYWIVDVTSQEEAVEWAKRAPLAGPGMKAEIRRVSSIDEFPQDNEWIQKERAWREATGQL